MNQAGHSNHSQRNRRLRWVGRFQHPTDSAYDRADKHTQQEQEIQRRAAFMVVSNVLEADPLVILAHDREQDSVERGFRLRKDPLFLAASGLLQKPERIVALGLGMPRCFLIYRLAEYPGRRQ